MNWWRMINLFTSDLRGMENVVGEDRSKEIEHEHPIIYRSSP